ncbi:MAG TPA: cytochrome c biogenesis protein CcdA [Chloroflexota bacterium]|nr:cytochrome c biogenesis protein CcdA [Chloroflexota bacterium]
MSELSLVFALSAGMLATVNPCGFVMLPAFIAYQLGAREAALAAQPLGRRVGRAALLAAAATAGFLAVFASTGLVLALGGRLLMRLVPWAALAVGGVLLAIGFAGLAGKAVPLRLPPLATTTPAAGLPAGFLFGIGYAVASLSCTLPIFLAVVSAALAAGGMASALAMFVSYALGMGTVLAVVALATALVKTAVVRWLLAAAPYAERLGALLLIGAGGYLVYYQLTTGPLLQAP